MPARQAFSASAGKHDAIAGLMEQMQSEDAQFICEVFEFVGQGYYDSRS